MRYPGLVLKITVALKFIVMSLLALAADDVAAELTAKANHDHITIDFLYHGSTVSVRGVSEPGTDLIIKISSPDEHEVLRQKGKVAGLFWMNVGELKFSGVPGVYFVHSTQKIEELLSSSERDRYGIGYATLQREADMSPVSGDSDKAKWFDEFIRFKETARLYGSSAGQISLTRSVGGKQAYYILTQWPYQAPPGNYTVTVYAVKAKRVVEMATSSVLVEQVGVVRSLATMAKTHSGLYGVISILAALSAGFGVGMVFKNGGGSH